MGNDWWKEEFAIPWPGCESLEVVCTASKEETKTIYTLGTGPPPSVFAPID